VLTRARAHEADVLILQGRTDEALEVIPRIPPGYRRDQRLALAYFARGNVDEGESMLAGLAGMAKRPDAGPEVAIAIAEVYAAHKDTDHAFEWLEFTLGSVRSQPNLMPRMFLRERLHFSPFLKALHHDRRWGELLAATMIQ
jgi:hypothetical protein